MKKAFTIVEVSILFVIFIIVAFLVAPLSLDDTKQAKNTSRWRSVQEDFATIFYTINTRQDLVNEPFESVFTSVFKNEIKSDSENYKITFMNGTYPNNLYRFNEYKNTYAGAITAYKLFYNSNPKAKKGVLMYDVNGKDAPNVWGRDVFGFDIYSDRFAPFCYGKSIEEQKQDCSANGTGLCCSNYYLLGGSFD